MIELLAPAGSMESVTAAVQRALTAATARRPQRWIAWKPGFRR